MDFRNILPACTVPNMREEFIGRVLTELKEVGILDWEIQAKEMLKRLNSVISRSHHQVSMRAALNKAFENITKGPAVETEKPQPVTIAKRTTRIEKPPAKPLFYPNLPAR